MLRGWRSCAWGRFDGYPKRITTGFTGSCSKSSKADYQGGRGGATGNGFVRLGPHEIVGMLRLRLARCANLSSLRMTKLVIEFGRCNQELFFYRLQDFAGGVRAGLAGQAGAGMGAASAEKEAVDGRVVARPIEERTHGEELVEG